jgi:hypothetical protein
MIISSHESFRKTYGETKVLRPFDVLTLIVLLCELLRGFVFVAQRRMRPLAKPHGGLPAEEQRPLYRYVWKKLSDHVTTLEQRSQVDV